jgi:hypothetical protein
MFGRLQEVGSRTLNADPTSSLSCKSASYRDFPHLWKKKREEGEGREGKGGAERIMHILFMNTGRWGMGINM